MNEEPTRRPEAAGTTLSNNGSVPAHEASDRDGVPVEHDGWTDDTVGYVSPQPDGAPLRDGAAPGVSTLSEDVEPAEPVYVPLPPRSPWSARLGSVREVVETVVLALVFFVALRAVVQNFRVEGSSMVPNFSDGQYVLVNKAVYGHVDSGTFPTWVPVLGGNSGSARYLFHPPQRGDVIVFHPPPPNDPSRDFIKRVIGVPGDTVDVGQGHIFVNGTELYEPYIHQATLPINTRFTHLTLAPDQFFVLGDNRGNSSDSRAWGPITADEIVGRTWIVYWPLSAWKVAPNYGERVPAPAAPSP